MKRIWKWVIKVGIILLIIVIFLAGMGIWRARRSWPQIKGTIDVAGLSAPVEVIRDKWGVPNIYAQNEHDLIFAQGYVHAQDRLWQMEIQRRLASGRLSEILGKLTLEQDRQMRILGLRRVAEQSWPRIKEEGRFVLETYAKGVNAYIGSHGDRLSIEFSIFKVHPEPWTPIDSLSWGNVMALDMGLNKRAEMLNAQVIAKMGNEAAQQLFPRSDKRTPPTVPAEMENFSMIKDIDRVIYNKIADYSWAEDFDPRIFEIADFWPGRSDWVAGSNNWVVHGSRTTSGMPLLANDVHMSSPMPSSWYENGLHGGRFNSIGFTLPGVPMVLVGHNQHIAWGITNLDPDVQDYYIEKLDNLTNPKQYEYMGEWHDLDIIPETIEVKGADPVTVNVLLTKHGPLVNMDDVTEEVPADITEKPVALRWNLYEGSLAIGAIVELNLASNWDEFRDALQNWDAISQNFVYADVEGNIGYQATGKLPIRAPSNNGIAPMPGWTGEYEWQGFIPFEEMPSFLNPASGFIATANSKVVSDEYPYQLCSEWYPGYRAIHINNLLKEGEFFGVKDMQNIQTQTYSLDAEALIPYLGAIEPENALQKEALGLINAWDLYFETDRIGASIYEIWYFFMIENLLGDEMGETLVRRYYRISRKHSLMLIELMKEADHPWFDDGTTPERETRDDIIRRSLADALTWLRGQYGKDPDKWEWGRVHTVTFRHLPLGRSGIPLIESLFNSPQAPSAGSRYTVNAASHEWSRKPLSTGHATALRTIIDLGNLDNMHNVNTTGQSEHLFHSNRADQFPMWQKGEYRTVPFTCEAVENISEATLTLIPLQYGSTP